MTRSLTRHPHARPGFTLIELSLAALIGSLIVVASFGVFNVMDRTDRTLKNRFDQTAELNRLHTVMRRTFVNLAMSNKTEPRPKPANAAAGANDGPSSSSSTGASRSAASPSEGPPGRRSDSSDPTASGAAGPSPAIGGGNPDAPPEPPRVILAEDRRVSEVPMVRLKNAAQDGRGITSPAEWRPQRLEVVLARPPVPIPRPDAGGRGISPFPEGNSGQDDFTDSEVAGTKLFRGIFELKPTLAGQRGPGNAPPRSFTTWSLWWRPMPPGSVDEAGAAGRVDEYDLGPPSLIASDLTYLRWQFFDDRVRKTEFSAAYVTKLPAYVDLEVQTASGLWADWMFEVDFIMSSEDAAVVGTGETRGPVGKSLGAGFKGAKPKPAASGKSGEQP